MKLLFFASLVLLTFQLLEFSSAKPSPPSHLNLACKNVSTTSLYPNCYIDLTIGMDMSSAMLPEANIATLSDAILQLATDYQQYFTNTAVVAFGDAGIDASDYFSTYEDLCEYIHDQEADSDNLGEHPKNLTDVLKIYRDKEMNQGRNYQNVFLLFTAITDPANINAATAVANEIRSAGTQITVVVLNTAGPVASYSNIADQVLYSPTYGIDANLTAQIVDQTCVNAGFTRGTNAPVTGTGPTGNPGNPLSDQIGTECNLHMEKAWLDIVLVVDTSKAMTGTDLQNIGVNMATALEALTIGQGQGSDVQTHTSRLALVTFTNASIIEWDLNSVTDTKSTLSKLRQLIRYRTSNTGGRVQGALRTAYNLLQDQASFRRQVIVLITATYDPSGNDDAGPISRQICENEITLFVVGYTPPDASSPPNTIKALSCPGYYYDNTVPTYFDSIALGLTQVNCFCPPDQPQFKVYNDAFKNFTVYADCLKSESAGSDPAYVHDACWPGIGASVTSLAKLDFIVDSVIETAMRQFTVGATRDNANYYWDGYNDTSYPLGKYPPFDQIDGNYGYFQKGRGFNWTFIFGADGTANAKPYVCQTRACDTDYFCDLSDSKK